MVHLHVKDNGEKILYVSYEEKADIDQRKWQNKILQVTSVLWCVYVIFVKVTTKLEAFPKIYCQELFW